MKYVARVFCVALLCLTAAVKADDRIELLNATLVAKFHFDPDARKGQMVGAYQVSFRTESEAPILSLPLLLNPGLQITKIVGAGGRRLTAREGYRTVSGTSALELNTATVTLPKPIKKGQPRQEIVVHFRGFLQDLSGVGLDGVKDTLHPDFAMIRAQSFAYPVVAAPNMAAIQEAWAHKPFYQVAFLDIPGHNTVLGNLQVAQKITNGALTRFEMKNDHPTGLMALAIAPFTERRQGVVSVAALGASNHTEPLIAAATAYANQIEEALGPIPGAKRLTIAQMPTGFARFRANGVLFLPPEASNRPEGLDDALFDLWRTNPGGRPGHWGNGLDQVLWTILSDASIAEQAWFQGARAGIQGNKTLGKTALADFAIEGFSAEGATVSALAFAVLHDLMGRDEFFAMVRALRADLGTGYADMASVGEFLDGNLENRKARKFAQNWFTKGRIGKDMDKVSNFGDLVKRYQ